MSAFRRSPPPLTTTARHFLALAIAMAFTSAALIVPVVMSSATTSSSFDADDDDDDLRLQQQQQDDDFCVADVSNSNTTTTFTLNNGGGGGGLLPCKPPQQISAHDFSSHLLRNPTPFRGKLGSAVNLASASTFPGLNTQGLSLARIDFLPNGLNPPHVHPRASELLFLVVGSLIVGFVTSNGTLFQQSLYAGDLFLFPRALPHFQLNPDDSKPAMAIAALNSQNPGVFQLAASLFATNPPIPQEVLQDSLGVGQSMVDNLTASVGATLC